MSPRDGGDFGLIHSPLVGSLTWRGVGKAMGSHPHIPRVRPQDLRAPYAEAFTQAVSAGTQSWHTYVVHSAAGFFAHLLPWEANAVIFVDALLPSPGRSWFETAPPPLAAHLAMISDKGWLPPWHTWFGASTMARLIPDTALRREFESECPQIHLSFLQTPTPLGELPHRVGYLQLSDSYAAEADEARARGWLLRTEPMHHLAMLSDPARLADIIAEMATELRAR
ncbi:MAG: hypothetical protein U1E50_02400 [Caulobacteraceae bacterium]